MALADRTRQRGKAATRQHGGQSPSCFLMAPARNFAAFCARVNGCVQQRKQLSKRFALIGLYF